MLTHGLENLLTKKETNDYLYSIGVDIETPSLSFLCKIISTTLASIPFQNLLMLTRPRVAPSFKEIKEDMLQGYGGLCTTMNPFLCGLLHCLGFNVGLLSASMLRPDCHMGLIIKIDAVDYWADIGNGFPYIEPLPLINEAEAHHPFLSWRLIQKGKEWHVQHRLKHESTWKVNQRFLAQAQHYSFFNQMRKEHYTQANYGPFLSAIRINCWNAEGGALMRDRLTWSIPGKRERINYNQAVDFLNKHFIRSSKLFSLLLLEGWILLDMKQ
jgi:arylamine N-acetyltransferase